MGHESRDEDEPAMNDSNDTENITEIGTDKNPKQE
jgi:hypothetical protein